MADEAFALSPISARAAQPSEEDYDAISQAFMETSRGRWFLGEYAKRNRNADTSMVLDAVARLEENLAAQRQPQPAPDNGLKEALAAIRGAVDEARVARARRPCAGGKAGAGPQGQPDHPGNRLAVAGNRRRRPDLRSDRFPDQRHRRRRRPDRIDHPLAAFDVIERAARGAGRQRRHPRIAAGRREEPVGLRSHLQRRRTYLGIFPVLHLDHIYYEGRVEVRGLDMPRTRKSLMASDHLPLVADLRIGF